MITIQEADHILREAIFPGGVETLPLAACAGRVLRKPVTAERDAPPFDRAMMDGFAFRAADATAHPEGLPIIGTLAAGEPPVAIGAEPAALEIMTGAVVPRDADCIVPVEDIQITENLLQIPPSAWIHGRFIDRKASDHPAGSEVLPAGISLGAPELAIAATEGRAALTVNAALAIHIITTGDEIVPLNTTPQPWQIRGSHAVALTALLSATDVLVSSEHVADDPFELTRVVQSALEKNQWLVLCGGVSKGGKDHVIDVLKSLGANLLFHRVAQRPGHPMAFATCDGIPIFCLPGNPLSVLCSARRHLVPAIHRQRGASCCPSPIPLALTEIIKPSPDSTRFLPITLRDGVATPVTFRNSGSLHALAGTSGFIEIPPSPAPLPAGTPFPYHPWQP